MLFAEWDGFTLLILFVVLGFLGEGVSLLTNRMIAAKQAIRGWAGGLGIATGALSFFVIFFPRNASSPEDLVNRILSAGLVGFCAGLAWYLVVALLYFAYQYVVAPPFRLLGRLIISPFSWWGRAREERRSRAQQRESQFSAAELSRTAAMQAEEHAAAQKRREAARAGCEVLFVSHSFDIRERFTREMFDAFVARHLGDDKSPEHVEKLARDLSDIIREHLRKVEPEPSLPDAEERRAARSAVQSCYDDNAQLLCETFPPLRFKVEMRVRIPDTATPEIAWKQARRMIQDLLTAVAAEKRNAPKAPPRSINPDDLDFT